MRTMPINLNVEGRRCLVVGGGTIALQKVQVLTASGIGVRVVAPFVMEAIEALDGAEIERRPFRETDLEAMAFAIAATDDAELNHEIWRLGHARGMLVNCVDDPAWCDFIFPSILRRGELAVAVSSGGSSPAMARLMRQWLEGEIEADFGATLELVRRMRREAGRRIGCPGARRAINECNARMALRARQGAPGDLARRMEEAVALAEGPAPVTVRIELDPEQIGVESTRKGEGR